MNRQTTLYSITNYKKRGFFFFFAALSFMNKNDESALTNSLQSWRILFGQGREAR